MLHTNRSWGTIFGVKSLAIVLAVFLLPGCSELGPAGPTSDTEEFLAMYNRLDQRLYTVAAEASWKASTDVSEEHTGERIGAQAVCNSKST